jgi:hypothetical protein
VRTPIEEVDREMSALARTVSRRAPVSRSAAFVVVTVAWIALAGRLLLLGDTRTVWRQVGAVDLLSIGGYAFTASFPRSSTAGMSAIGPRCSAWWPC